jgi:hypothetical protein
MQKQSDQASSQGNLTLEWYIEPSEEKEFFHLISAADTAHPRLLHLGENFEQNGDPITLVEKNKASENTKIRFDAVSGLEGYYYMTFFKASGMASRSNDSKTVVHVDPETKHINLWEKTPIPSCFWQVIPAHLSPPDLIGADEHNCFAIENMAGGFLMLKGGSIFNGTQITTAPFANQTTFKWKLKNADGDYFYVISARDAHHERTLTQHENSQDDGAKITLWELEPEQRRPSSMVSFEPAQDQGGHWCIIFNHSSRYMQIRLGELSQIRKRSQQAPEPNLCWRFVRCIPNFPKST